MMRTGQLSDLGVILSLEQEAFAALMYRRYQSSRTALRRYLTDPTRFVLVGTQGVVYGEYLKPGYAAIDSIAVRRQGRGFGTALLRETLRLLRLRGVTSIHAEVAVTNTASLKMFRRAGFRKGKVHPRYYGTVAAQDMEWHRG